MRYQNISIVISIAIFGSVLSCAPEQEKPHARSHTPDRQDSKATKLRPVKSPLLAVQEANSCQALHNTNGHQAVMQKSFSLFHEFNVGEQTGRVEILSSPFTQSLLTRKELLPTRDKAFLETARQRFEQGELAAWKWLWLKFLYYNWRSKFKETKFEQLNEQVARAFPGLFGKSGGLKKHYFYKILKSNIDLSQLGPETLRQQLSKPYPLFATKSWAAFTENTRQTLGAALEGWYGKEDQENKRLCSLALFHRAWAQLLALKGHQKPEWSLKEEGKRVQAVVQPLSINNPEFTPRPVPGAFINTQERELAVLSPSNISSYQPSQKPYVLRDTPPWQQLEQIFPQRGGLSAHAAFFESLVYFFEATQPAAPWLKPKDSAYILGDFKSLKKNTLLPFKAHSLSLGLLQMALKNLKAFHLREVNAQGQLLRSGEEASALTLGNFRQKVPDRTSYSLADTIHLVRATVYLEKSLKDLTNLSPTEIIERNSTYTYERLARLLGSHIYTQDLLDKLVDSGKLDPEQKKKIKKLMRGNNSLLDHLQELRLPLAFNLVGLGRSPQGCRQQITWNLQTGQKSYTKPCTQKTQKKFRKTLKLIARSTQAPILLEKLKEAKK